MRGRSFWAALAAVLGILAIFGGGAAAARLVATQTATCSPSNPSVVTNPDGSRQAVVTCTFKSPAATAKATAVVPAPTPTVTPTPTPTPTPTVTPTPTPTPTPTSTPPPGTFPNASNTGVPAGTVLSTYTGPSVITVDGTVIDSKNIGCIQVKASGVVIKNSHISCADIYAVTAFDGDITGTPLLLQDDTIDCQTSSATGIGEAMVTVVRANISGCENGFDINQKITVQDSFIHALTNTATSHSDGIQFASGHFVNSQVVTGSLNVTIEHNTIYSTGADGSLGTSAIIANPAGDTNILIENNLLAGGAFTLYCDRPGSGTNFQVLGNHFSKVFSPNYGAYGPDESCANETVVSGNVDHETGLPMTLD